MWLEDVSAGREYTFQDKEDEVQLSSWLTVNARHRNQVWTPKQTLRMFGSLENVH